MAFQTLTTILAAVRSAIDEPTTKQWTDTEITRWINEAARDTTRRTRCLKATTTVATVNAQADYSPPTNCIQVNKIELTSGSFIIPLEYKERNEMDMIWKSHQGLAGVPLFWTIWGYGNSELFSLFPVPNAIMSSKLWYYRLSTDAVSGSDPIEVPEGWYDLVVDYATAQALRKDADPRWIDSMTLYENKLRALHTDSHRLSDRPDASQWQRVDPYAQQAQPAMVPIQQQPGGPGQPFDSFLLPNNQRR